LLSAINLPSVGELLVKYGMIGLIKTCQYDTNTLYENDQVLRHPLIKRRTVMEMRFFKCKVCGCEFEADNTEYRRDYSQRENCGWYTIKCPTCDRWVTTDYEEDNV
jgi:hypothetical protein